jgi:hypothetical protein
MLALRAARSGMLAKRATGVTSRPGAAASAAAPAR